MTVYAELSDWCPVLALVYSQLISAAFAGLKKRAQVSAEFSAAGENLTAVLP